MFKKVYRWLMLKIIPYIRFTVYYTKFKGYQYLRGYKLLRPGMVVLTVDKKKLTTFLIPGTFSHAAMCVSIEDEWQVSEMTHLGYTKSAFFDICKESDRVVLGYCKDWTVGYLSSVISKCKSFQNTDYDLSFKLGVKELYCSELIYHSDYEHRLNIDLSDIHGLGRKYVSPDGIYNASNFEVIWDSDNEILT